jgi:hypothetical protein
VKEHIRKKIQDALMKHSQRDLGMKESPQPGPRDVTFDVEVMVNDLITRSSEKQWEITEIAVRHSADYHTIRKQFKGRPGYLQWGGLIRITDTLYRTWLAEGIIKGLGQN